MLALGPGCCVDGLGQASESGIVALVVVDILGLRGKKVMKN